MTTIIIKQTGAPGRDAKMFRAYEPAAGAGPDRSLGVSASTTGNPSYGVIRCAAKAFVKFTEPKGELEEVETRIRLKPVVADMIWLATLEPKELKP
jgi:hypothetical protein